MIFPNWFFRNQVQINRGVAGAVRTSLIFFTVCTADLLLFVWTRRVSRDLQIILLLWKWNTDQQKRKQTLHPLKYFKLKPLTFKQFFRTRNFASKLLYCFVFLTEQHIFKIIIYFLIHQNGPQIIHVISFEVYDGFIVEKISGKSSFGPGWSANITRICFIIQCYIALD